MATSARTVSTFVLLKRVVSELLWRGVSNGNVQNLTSHDKTENGTLGEGVEGVCGLVLLVLLATVDNEAAEGKRRLRLREAHLGDGDGRRDGHDRGRDEVLRGDTHGDVGAEHGAGDGRESGGHDEVQLRLGHHVDVRADQARGLALANPGGAGGDDGLGTGDVHRLEEEPGKVLDDPLHDAEVVHHLHKRDEEDNCAKLAIKPNMSTWDERWDGMSLTVLTKNQCFAVVSASKKKPEPASALARKSAARVATHLKMSKPAVDLSTKSAIACCMKRPTMTVGL